VALGAYDKKIRHVVVVITSVVEKNADRTPGLFSSRAPSKRAALPGVGDGQTAGADG